MREIKFRAFDEQNRVMHLDFQFIKTGDNGNDWIIFTSDKQPVSGDWKDNPYFSQQLKIMQFTGMKDSKGQPIYEGDIIKATFEGEEIIGEVFYEAPYFDLATDYNPECNTLLFLGANNIGEVIGNIHEHPHLLTPQAA